MRFSPVCRRSGFTLVELLVVTGLAALLGGGIFVLVQAGTVISTKTLAGNTSYTENRLSMDRAIHLLQVAYNTPVLIDHTGAAVSSGPAQGIRFLRYMGAPYVVTIPSGGILSTATGMKVAAATNALVPLPEPQPNDILIINTTAMASGSNTQVMAYLDSPVQKSAAGNRITYTLKLSRALGTTVTADTGATVTAILVRPTALVLEPTATGRELRLYESFPAASALDTTASHQVVTDLAALASANATPSASDPMSDDNAKPFSIVIQNGRPFAKVSLSVRSRQYDRYLSGKQMMELDTFLKTDSVIALKCNQN